MSKEYFNKTRVSKVDKYSAIFMKNKFLLLFSFFINIHRIVAFKKIKFIVKSPYQYFRRKFALYISLSKYKDNICLDENGFADFNIEKFPGGKNILNKYTEIYKNTSNNGTRDIVDSKILFDDKDLVEFATREEILNPIGKYLGTAPTLHAMSMWRAKPTELSWGAPFFHMDSMDTKNIRLFIYLSDVDEGGGPVAYLPKKLSRKIIRKTGYLGGSFSDKHFFELVSPEQVLVKTGKAGTMFTLDSTSCFHLGSRCLDKERVVLHLSYASFHNKDDVKHYWQHYKNRKNDISLPSLSKFHISCN